MNLLENNPLPDFSIPKKSSFVNKNLMINLMMCHLRIKSAPFLIDLKFKSAPVIILRIFIGVDSRRS
jgi:hypothetical protein